MVLTICRHPWFRGVIEWAGYVEYPGGTLVRFTLCRDVYIPTKTLVKYPGGTPASLQRLRGLFLLGDILLRSAVAGSTSSIEGRIGLLCCVASLFVSVITNMVDCCVYG